MNFFWVANFNLKFGIQKLISNITNKKEKYLDKQGKILLQ
ncbi:hypothetical protein SPAR105_0234 [Streptococcus pneumoniae GA47760]|nr:hypothetical protein SPAR31_0237 [Streptococcus pneumoniae GA13494]EHZ75256.1 hypothetical protein SPAR105_0234 [Streptococcus pneumoniae GA47760]